MHRQSLMRRTTISRATAMMSLSPSNSDERPAALLDPRKQGWVWQKGWRALRDIQTEAIRAILQSDADILITAPTASGKTEAAFFPILTAIAGNPREGIRSLYVGPLKALINDQYSRLEEVCERIE